MENPLIMLFKSKTKTAIVLLILLLFIGVLGFRLISNYSWIDAVYMTVITVTTVGFGEVHPLDSQAKIFTVFLILTSVVIVGYAFKIMAMLGGIILGISESLFSGLINSDYKDVFNFSLLVVILICRPQGLLGRPLVAKV